MARSGDDPCGGLSAGLECHRRTGRIRSDRFDMAAKADITGDLTEDLQQSRLANLLAKRFKLRIHESTEVMPAKSPSVEKASALDS
jgi:uncharacterized protein (TIGR03435 family)